MEYTAVADNILSASCGCENSYVQHVKLFFAQVVLDSKAKPLALIGRFSFVLSPQIACEEMATTFLSRERAQSPVDFVLFFSGAHAESAFVINDRKMRDPSSKHDKKKKVEGATNDPPPPPPLSDRHRPHHYVVDGDAAHGGRANH